MSGTDLNNTLSVVQTNSLIELDTINYDVIAGPSASTPLVQAAREQILQTIEIEKLVRNLSRTDDLLHIAACGVAGFLNPDSKKSLSSQVMNLQYKLRKNTGEMGSALLLFGESAGNMLPILRGAFKFLYELHEDDCITRLARCEEVAKKMAATSSTLKNTFEGLAEETQKIAEDTTQTRDLRESARQASVKRQTEIEAQDALRQSQKKSLAEQIPQVKGWYEEAKAAQTTADGRMFTMAIVGSITKAFGDGLAAGLQFKAAPAIAGAQLASAIASKAIPPPDPKDKPKTAKSKKTSEVLSTQAAYRVAKETLTQAEASYETAQKSAAKAQTALDDLEAPFIEAREEFEAAKKAKPKDAKGKKDLQAKKDTYEELKGPYDEAEEALEEANTKETEANDALVAAKEKEKNAKAEKEEADASAPLAGVAAGLSSAGASAQDTSSAYAEIAANYGKEKTKYLDMLMDLQKQEREALGEIAKFAVEMQTEKGNEQLEQAAVESLHIAVGVLKYVVVILQDVTQFWTQMAVACRKMADENLRLDIEVYMKRTPAERIREYSSDDFIFRMLTIAAQWHALKLVATEYQKATMQVFEKLGETYKENLPIIEARAQAKILAAKLNDAVEKDIKGSEAITEQIVAAKKETEEILAAAAA